METDWALVLALDILLTTEALPSASASLSLLPSLFLFLGEDFWFLIRRIDIDDQPDFTKPFIFDPGLDIRLGVSVLVLVLVLVGERDKGIAVDVDAAVDTGAGVVAVVGVFSPAREVLFFDSAVMARSVLYVLCNRRLYYYYTWYYDTICPDLLCEIVLRRPIGVQSYGTYGTYYYGTIRYKYRSSTRKKEVVRCWHKIKDTKISSYEPVR